MRDKTEHVDREENEEEQEELVIPVADAVVHERAVVVESLDALVAVVAVPSLFRS